MSNRLIMIQVTGLDEDGYSTTWLFANEAFTNSSTGFVDGRLDQPGLVEKSMYGESRITGQTPVGKSAIVINNADGEHDDILEYSFDGQVAYINERLRTTFASDGVLKTFTVEQPTADGDNIVFQCREFLHSLDYTMLEEVYDGSNAGSPFVGIEGTASDIKGQNKPIVIGQVRNITPVLVNDILYIYQVDGQRGLLTGWAMTVFDKRSPLTAGAVYVSQADMEANAPALNQYRVWPAGGCFRLGSVPVGRITADVLNPPFASGTSNLADAVAKISINFVVAARCYFTNNGTAGIYAQDGRTSLAALQEVLESVNGFATMGATPTLSFGSGLQSAWASHLTDPASLPFSAGVNTITVTEDVIVKGTLQRIAAQEYSRGLPVWRVNVRYQKNYTVMNETDLAGVAAEDQNFCKQEYRVAVADDASVKTQWPQAAELTFTSIFDTEATAQAEADRLLALFSVRRQMFKFKVSAEYVRGEVSDVRAKNYFQLFCRVNLTVNRYGLEAGKLFVVTGMVEDFQNDLYELTVWG
jgi:hypothetical protein